MESGINSIKQTQYVENTFIKPKKTDSGFSELIQPPGRNMNPERAPYDELAVDGMIAYGSAVFFCDTKKNQLLLGDTTDKTKCLNIPLSGGGNLIVNRDNLEQLASAIDMFNPRDQYLIMRAMLEDKKIQEIKGEIEESDSIMIGGRSYTQEEWDKLVEQFDKAEEEIQQQAEEAKQKAIEKAMKESDVYIAYEKMNTSKREIEEEKRK